MLFVQLCLCLFLLRYIGYSGHLFLCHLPKGDRTSSFAHRYWYVPHHYHLIYQQDQTSIVPHKYPVAVQTKPLLFHHYYSLDSS